MRLAALFSGGKDSTFAIMEAQKKGHQVVCLVTMSPKREDSYMFHYPCLELTRLQAESMGIRQIWKETSGVKELELMDLKEVLSGLKGQIDGVLSGAVSSRYQKSRIDGLCSELGLESYAPLWGRDAYDLIKDEVNAGLDFIVVAVSTGGLDRSWLGRRVSHLAIEELRFMSRKMPFNIQFEGGEAETFVSDCPLFRQKVVIQDFDKTWDGKTSSGYIAVKRHSLVPKNI